MHVNETQKIITVLNRGGLVWAVEYQAEAWHIALERLPYQLGKDAVEELLVTFDRTKGAYVKPADVLAAARTIRARRINAAPPVEIPDEIAADGTRYTAFLRAYHHGIANGGTPQQAQQHACDRTGLPYRPPKQLSAPPAPEPDYREALPPMP